MSALPRSIVWLVRAVVPRARADTILADLEDEYRAARTRSGAGAGRWLVRETASIVAAYSRARCRTPLDLAPVYARDLQLVLRSVRRAPLPAVAAAGMLAVGVVAVLIATGLTNALLFRQVSLTHGAALRRIVAIDRQGRMTTRFSHLELQQVREQMVDAGTMGAVYLQPVVVRAAGNDVQTMAEIVDGHYFGLTGTPTVIGRGVLASDDRPGAAPVAVIAEPFWRRRLGSADTAVGSTLAINGTAYTIVGVANALGSSTFLGASVDVWVPLAQADPLLDRDWRTNIANRWFTPFVLPTRTEPVVAARLANATTRLANNHGDVWRERRLQTAEATAATGGQRAALTLLATVLGGLAALILVAAASSVSSVLLARAALARRAAAIHLSLGSGRAAIVRRQLLEGALLGLGAGGLGVALYSWARVLVAEIAVLPTLALRLDLPFDLSLIGATLASGTVAGVLLGIAPALWASRCDSIDGLRDGESRWHAAGGIITVRRGLVSVQVALSLALVSGAVLFARSVAELSTADLGFTRDRLVAVDFDVTPASTPLDELPWLAREALARALALPGVAAAAMSNRAPVDQSTPTLTVQDARGATSSVDDVTVYLITARYFDVVDVPLVAGREFSDSETATDADVAIVNEALAELLWPRGDPLDRALYLPAEGKTLRVIGVARNSKYRTIVEMARPHLYRPTAPALGLTLLARTTVEPHDTLRVLQRELDRVGPGLTGFFPRTLGDHLAVQLLPTRAAATAATWFGALALTLSAVALYGLVSWFVALRRREIGIRMALGARPTDVSSLVVRQALIAALPGAIAGVMLSLVLAIAARSTLYGVSPGDPAALGAAVGALAAVVLVAAYVPSRTATRVEPASVLRN